MDAHVDRPIRIVVAPDSFKGSATAARIAEAIATGIAAGLAGIRPEPAIRTLPLADGGEGSLDAILGTGIAAEHRIETTDAAGRPVTARYAISLDGRTGIVEAAEANGLPLVSDLPLQPLTASTFGVGTVLRAVLDAGVEEVVLFLGGSASTDGGAGMLQALGAALTDADGRALPPGGAALRHLNALDTAGVHPRARSVRWRIACDVTHPLVGPRGTAAVFAPQKGANAHEVRALEAGLERLAAVLADRSGIDIRGLPGAGAAGGTAAPLVALFGGELEPGWRVVAASVGAEAVLADADLVITGEGRVDAQSLAGKVVSGVREMTPDAVPVIVLAGSVGLGPAELRAAGITAAFALASGPATLHELRASVLADAERAAASVARLFAAGALRR